MEEQGIINFMIGFSNGLLRITLLLMYAEEHRTIVNRCLI